jgi:hypothetical protein
LESAIKGILTAFKCMKYLDGTTLSEDLTCPKCGWTGCGHEASKVDLFLTDALELYCKECDYYFGFISTTEN